MLGLSICPACASVTLSADDQRAIIADNAALLAEIDEYKISLKTEREETDKIIDGYKAVVSQDNAIIANRDAEIKAEKRKIWRHIFTGLIIGGIIGAIAAN